MSVLTGRNENRTLGSPLQVGGLISIWKEIGWRNLADSDQINWTNPSHYPIPNKNCGESTRALFYSYQLEIEMWGNLENYIIT